MTIGETPNCVTYLATVDRPGAAAGGLLDDGREWLIYPQLFTHRLVVGAPDVGCYDDCWCYETLAEAVVGVLMWDGTGEPSGWHRHPPSGRRRPDGDPEREYVNP